LRLGNQKTAHYAIAEFYKKVWSLTFLIKILKFMHLHLA
jgi:hypothetical protein